MTVANGSSPLHPLCSYFPPERRQRLTLRWLMAMGLMPRVLLPTALSTTALLTTGIAHAELTIEIAKAADRAPQIAVVPFAADPGFQTIIQNDLNRSGKLASASGLPAQPTQSNDIQLTQWQAAHIPYVVVGQVQSTDNEFRVQYELVNTDSGQRLLGEQMSVPKTRLREAAHLIADKIYQAITGIQGDFSGRIAYILKNRVEGQSHFILQVADTDGATPRTILDSKEPLLSPAWTPDGKALAYVSFESGRPAIYLQQLATGERKVLAQFKGINGAPSFSPDGHSMLFTSSRDGNPDIYEMSLASKSIRRLTNDNGIDTEARYAPDGKSFIFTSDRGGSPQLYEYRFSDSSVRRLTFKGAFNGRGSISGDGKTLAFVHRPSGQHFQIAVQDRASGVISVVTPTPMDESPSFSPNGQMVVYATRENDRGLLSIVSIDGRFRMRMPSLEGEVREPAWSPTR